MKQNEKKQSFVQFPFYFLWFSEFFLFISVVHSPFNQLTNVLSARASPLSWVPPRFVLSKSVVFFFLLSPLSPQCSSLFCWFLLLLLLLFACPALLFRFVGWFVLATLLEKDKKMARDCLYETDVCVCVWSEQGIFVEKKNGWANGNQTTNTNETWAITIEWIETEGAEKKWGGGVFFIEDVLEADSTAVVGRRWTLETQKQWQRLRRRIIGCATGPDWGRTTAAASWCAPVRWWWSWCSRTGRCSAGSSDGPPPPAFHLIRRQNNKQTVKNILYGVSKLAQ